MGKLRFGFIGAGGITHGHAQRITQSGEGEVVAVADPNPASLTRFREQTGLDPVTYADHKAMLTQADLDCVLIGSPHTLHFPQSVDALRAGCHVLCEKPMVCTAEEGRALLDEVAGTDKVFMISYQRHADPQFRWIKAFIDEGGLGQPAYITAMLTQPWLQHTKGSWRQDPSLSGGGQLIDSGSHMVDVLTWLAGPVDRVYAFCDHRGAPVDINSAVSFRFRNGVLGTLNIIGDAMQWREDWTISGDRATVFVRNGTLLLCEPDGHAKEVDAAALPPELDIDTAFIDAVKGRRDVLVPAEIGLRVVELTEAAWRSAAEGVAIDTAR